MTGCRLVGAVTEPVDRTLGLLDTLQIHPAQARTFRHFYNSAMDKYGNEVYARVETRLVHWLNYMEGGWFSERITKYLNHVIDFDLVIDLGYSVPYPYAHSGVLRRCAPRGTRFLFVDHEPSAEAFYRAFVSVAGLEDRLKVDQMILANIEETDGQQRVLARAREAAPGRVLVVMSEVIEHLGDPEQAWKLAVALASLGTDGQGGIYVSLPVGERIPSHTLQFASTGEARAYVQERVSHEMSWVLEPPNKNRASPFLRACYCALVGGGDEHAVAGKARREPG